MTESRETHWDEPGAERTAAFLPEELQDGDYAVDEQHGIGIFHGLTRLATPTPAGEEPAEREYLVLEFDGGDKLYVPSEQADRVRPYVGGDGSAPTLSRLTGGGWARAVADARAQVKEVAAELASLQAERASARGHSYRRDTQQQSEMERSFSYSETPDQLTAIQDIKRDLENNRPMDRLLVGDVGYGKTEVAVRAAFKVVQEGRQAALLCPTSVLASQHHQTFLDRLASFDVRIELLSRFRSAGEQQEVLNGLRNGAVSVVIGTHRLLSEDVKFKDLGLVIVDEEQRFGVLHKEKLKQLRKSVDILTMTATPIPRTLHMALAG
ncbi:MAG: DEAD/DEAH box helicase, partial [Armatimonadota bacterium]